jgi:DNA ligase-associated metallophosphoesterase
LPVPSGNSAKDLSRISALLEITGATRLLVLGDLIHNRRSHQKELADSFLGLRERHPRLHILLIRGNHDRRAGPTPPAWDIQQAEEPFDDGPLVLSHYPRSADKPLLCGHIHPVVNIRDFDRSRISLPCFSVEEKVLTLPAFGSFTGGFKVRPEPNRKIIVIAGDSLHPIRYQTKSSGF